MLDRLKTLIHLPGQMLLSWRLFGDPRVPLLPKVVLVAGVLLVLSPLDVFEWVPFVGGLGGIALFALVLQSFINAAPEEVRSHHEALLGIRGF